MYMAVDTVENAYGSGWLRQRTDDTVAAKLFTQCDTVWYTGTYSLVQCDTASHSVTQLGTVWYSLIHCGTLVQCNSQTIHATRRST